jgi:pimeloyl-ACP methyl ester carboxylesterase
MLTTAVEIDSLSLRVRTAGLHGCKAGQAAIIFESGGGAPLETWDPILSTVATFAPVVAYDRAGTGQSSWDSLPPTPQRGVARLRRLLATLDVAPPYMLVGHSWGGALIRYFGGASPADIAGMVYIDPADITQEPADEITIFESIGAGRAARDAFYDVMERAMADAPAPLRAEGAVTMNIFRQDVASRQLPSAPDVPTTVILAGKPASFPPNGLPFDTTRYADAVQRHRRQRLRGWVRGGGEFLVAMNAGHLVHADDPELVIEAIRRLQLL